MSAARIFLIAILSTAEKAGGTIPVPVSLEEFNNLEEVDFGGASL